MVDVEVSWDNLDAAFDAFENECAEVVRGVTVQVWNGVLSKTPQFEGRMAASWSYSVGSPNYVDRSNMVDHDTSKLAAHRFSDLGSFLGLYRGHPIAIGVANAANRGADRVFKLGDQVHIANGVDHGEGPYSDDVEAGRVALRPENRPGEPVRRTLDWIEARYADINQNQAMTLRSLTIGGLSGNDNP